VLETSPIDSTVIAHVRQVTSRYGLLGPEIVSEASAQELSSTEATVVKCVAGASLLVAGLDQLPSDSLVHFAAGVVVAEPTAGASKRRLDRRALLVVRSAEGASNLAADSARRVEKTVRVVLTSGVAEELTSYGSAYQRWRRDQEGDA
jgi:hypothetical protein